MDAARVLEVRETELELDSEVREAELELDSD